MEDLVNSFKAHLYDRITSPLLSSFLLSWAAWNHRLFVVLLSDLKVLEKFDFIDSKIYPTWREVCGVGFAFPLASALFLLYVYPIPARKVYEHVRAQQHQLKRLQQKIDDEMPMTNEDAQALRQLVRRATSDAEREVQVREETISRLKLELEASSSEIKRLDAQLAQSSAKSVVKEDVQLNEMQTEMLARIASKVSGVKDVYFDRILPEISEVLRQALLEQLHRVNLVTTSYEGGGAEYLATAEGREYLIKINHPLMRASSESTSQT